MKRVIISLVSLGALSALGIFGGRVLYARSAPMAAPPVARVEARSISLEVREVGTVEAFRKIDVKSKVAGQVGRVLVDVGHTVKANETVIELDPIDKTRELAQALTRQEGTRAQLETFEELAHLKESAFEKGALSALDVALAKSDVTRLRAQLRNEAADVALRNDQVAYTRLRAPIDGVVLERNIQPGEMVTPGVSAMVDGKPLLVIAQIDRVLVRTELSQLDVVHVRQGQSVDVRVDALPGTLLHGEVYRVSANGRKSERRRDANLLVFPIDVLVDRSQPGAEAVAPGMIADLAIGRGEQRRGPAVPLEAIVRRGDKTYVRKPSPANVKSDDDLVEVTLGAQDQSHVEIVDGMLVGQEVVLPAAPPAPKG